MFYFSRKSIYTFLIISFSIIIIFRCAYFHSLKKEGLTNNNRIILMGDSVLNNSNYVSSGKSVENMLKTKTNNILNVSKDGSTINDLYSQLDKIPIGLDNAETYIFISAGGNDILNKRSSLTSAEITKLFNTYRDFFKAFRTKLGSAKLNIINLYLPANPRYQSYKTQIDFWNELINKYSNGVGEMYNVIDLNSVLKSPNDFVYDIEPSELGSEKIANLIYLTR